MKQSGLRCCRWPILLAAVLSAYPASAAPQLIKTGSTGEPDRVTFTNVSRPNARQTVLIGSNPVIQGDNLYAPDLLRVADRWYCYHGGWLTPGQQFDRIYLGVSAALRSGGAMEPRIASGRL